MYILHTNKKSRRSISKEHVFIIKYAVPNPNLKSFTNRNIKLYIKKASRFFFQIHVYDEIHR